MSDIDVSITRPTGKRLIKLEVSGKLSDAEWEEFRECVAACVKRYGKKLKLSFTQPRSPRKR
jgi:hypothetical protein